MSSDFELFQHLVRNLETLRLLQCFPTAHKKLQLRLDPSSFFASVDHLAPSALVPTQELDSEVLLGLLASLLRLDRYTLAGEEAASDALVFCSS